MKLIWLQRLAFAGKSLLWSAALYSAVVVILDWNDIATAFSSQQNISIVQTEITPLENDRIDTMQKNIQSANRAGYILAIINSVSGGI